MMCDIYVTFDCRGGANLWGYSTLWHGSLAQVSIVKSRGASAAAAVHTHRDFIHSR
jgi:hypothetical protein